MKHLSVLSHKVTRELGVDGRVLIRWSGTEAKLRIMLEGPDEEKIKGRMREFLMCSDSPTGPVLMDAVEIVKSELPKEVAEGKIPFAGKLGNVFQNSS